MFEGGFMGASARAALATPDGGNKFQAIAHLQREIGRLQRRRSDLPIVPLLPALAPLMPEGGLQSGAVYTFTPSLRLASALIAAATQQGAWCAVVGLPTFGIESAEAQGVDPERLIVVPHPHQRWFSVISALSEVVSLIMVHPSTPISAAEAQRFQARLRDRACTVLIASENYEWPNKQGELWLSQPEWRGLGNGWGVISECEVTVSARIRGLPAPRHQRVIMPNAQGQVQAVSTVVDAAHRWRTAG
ncbi:hypothetical protein [Microbacterium sp. YY-01]|uniref:hypothetical protein n=1 Tax=Microbacterium sp. YY-01 TaxID=3421634 RepID=UPI003D166FE8